MSIQILSPGALTTVQDYGRFGYGEIGFSPSGAVDASSMEIANILLGNEMGEAVLECTMLGPSLHFTKDNVIAITGAYMTPRINNKAIPMNAAVAVNAGEDLILGYAVSGCRSYIAFAGGLQIKESLGSKSTNMKCAIGGFQGRALKAKDEIQFTRPINALKGIEKRVYQQLYAIAAPRTIQVVLGPQEDYFTEEGLKTFLSGTYKLTNDSNRMACKLTGPIIASKQATDIISDGISLGSIQVSSNGLPIVMLSDRQTTGGYAKIATVISTDIPSLAQCKPEDEVRFKSITLSQAHQLYLQHIESRKKLQKKFEI